MSLLRRSAHWTLAGILLAGAAAWGHMAVAANPALSGAAMTSSVPVTKKASATKAKAATYTVSAAPETVAEPATPSVPSSAPPPLGAAAHDSSRTEEVWHDEWENGEMWESHLPAVWSHWTIDLEAVFLRRSTPDSLQLSGSDTIAPDRIANADQLTFDNEAGPRLGVIRRGISGWDLEFNFLGIEGFTSQLDAPGAFDIRVPSDNPGGLFSSTPLGLPLVNLQVLYQSQLFNEELNLRRPLNSTWTGLFGVRAMQIYERFDVNAGSPFILGNPLVPFLSIETENRLYGLQVGGEGKVAMWGPFTLLTTVKAGLFENNSEQSTANLPSGFPIGVPPEQQTPLLSPGSRAPNRLTASTNQASFVGEIGLTGSYQVAETIFIRAGYQLLWVDDVALASEQYVTNEFQTIPAPPDTSLRDISAKGSLFYHGATVGFELTW